MSDSVIIVLWRMRLRRLEDDWASAWKKARKRWMSTRPPVKGYYKCAICLMPVKADVVSFDHVVRKSDAPSLALCLWNIQPTHARCNNLRDAIMREPSTLMRMRSLPLGHYEREVADRVITQAIYAYRQCGYGYLVAPPTTS